MRLTKLKYLEVVEEEPENIKYFLLMKKFPNMDIGNRWQEMYMDPDYDQVKRQVENNKGYDKDTHKRELERNIEGYEKPNYEYKIFVLYLPS